MNNNQKQLKEKADKFFLAIDSICNNSKVSMLDKEILMDRIKDIYDFLITNDFNEQDVATHTIEEEKQEIIEEKKPIIEQEKEETPIIETPSISNEEKEEEKNKEIFEENKDLIEKSKEILEQDNDVPKQEEIIEEKEQVIIPPIIEQEKQEEVVEDKEIETPQEDIEEQIKKTEEQIKQLHKEISNNSENNPILTQQQEKSQETSSVLEYLHEKVIKDIPQKEESITREADLFSERPASIAERFEEENKSNLRTAIGVSEKFMFINDLFSGNITEYTNFINRLNDANDITASQNIINQTKQKHKWATTSLAYTTLETLIEKRFSK
jgi:hypothetical protein